jgi:hypothetical protein
MHDNRIQAVAAPRTTASLSRPRISRKAAKNARSSCPACLTQSRQERQEFVPCLSHAKPPGTPGVRALPVSRKAARNARSSCSACLTQSRQERQEFVPCLSHAKPPRTPGVRALPGRLWPMRATVAYPPAQASASLRQAQDRPFDSPSTALRMQLRTGPSTGSGQALRQAQDRLCVSRTRDALILFICVQSQRGSASHSLHPASVTRRLADGDTDEMPLVIRDGQGQGGLG